MSTENDVPLGEDSRRYYEQKFGERIRQVNRRGGPLRDPGGSNWNGRVGAGVVIGVLFVIIRIMIAASRSGSHTPSYTYNPPPPPPQFDAELQRRLNEMGIRGDQKDVFAPNDMPMFGKMPEAEEVDPLLTEADVPLLEGLCYRIHQENLRNGQTPGGRIHELLGEGARTMLDQVAQGQLLKEDVRDDLLDALNGVLKRPDMCNGRSFDNVRGFALMQMTRVRPVVGGDLWNYNRKVLEMCYPEQIIPLRERALLDGPTREQWRRRALLDLQKARRE